jgi:hypothetical protein
MNKKKSEVRKRKRVERSSDDPSREIIFFTIDIRLVFVAGQRPNDVFIC